MKNHKTILLLVIVIIGIFTLSFKSQESTKEYAMMRTCAGFKGDKSIAIHFSNETKYYPFKTSLDDEIDFQTTKLLNELSNEGWEIISTDVAIVPSGNQLRTFHLERIKK